MAITMGFMLRVDNYPNAVALPPLQQGVRPVPPTIEAQRIVEPTNILHSNSNRNHLLQQSAGRTAGQHSPLTYSAKGIAQGAGQLAGGRLLDTYA